MQIHWRLVDILKCEEAQVKVSYIHEILYMVFFVYLYKERENQLFYF